MRYRIRGHHPARDPTPKVVPHPRPSRSNKESVDARGSRLHRIDGHGSLLRDLMHKVILSQLTPELQVPASFTSLPEGELGGEALPVRQTLHT